MGANDGLEDQAPVHSVSLHDFNMSKYEVSQELFHEVMGENPSYVGLGIGNNFPVNYIEWDEAVVFCNTLSEMEGLDTVYTFDEGK